MNEFQQFAYDHPLTRATPLHDGNYRRSALPGVALALSVNK